MQEAEVHETKHAIFTESRRSALICLNKMKDNNIKKVKYRLAQLVDAVNDIVDIEETIDNLQEEIEIYRLGFPAIKKAYEAAQKALVKKQEEGDERFGNERFRRECAGGAISGYIEFGLIEALDAVKKGVVEPQEIIDLLFDNDSKDPIKDIAKLAILREADKISETISESKNRTIYSLVADGDLAPHRGADRLGITTEQLRSDMTAAGYQLPA